MANYDAIVVGVGGVGAAALAHLAQRGLSVLGLDPHAPPHHFGSSHGHTRIIRQAYFEHPNYVPLLRRAYELWEELQRRHGQQLFFPVGLVQLGPPDGTVLTGVRTSAQQHGLDVDWLSADEFARHFPMLPIDPQHAAVLERNAGYLLVEDCVEAHFRWALDAGAEFAAEPVRTWKRVGSVIELATDTQTHRCEHLVVAGGAWAPRLLESLHLPLTVREKHLHWFPTTSDAMSVQAGCPTFLYDLPEGCFYGFPAIDQRGVKLAEHSGGRALDAPEQSARNVDAEDRRRVIDFAQRLVGVSAEPTEHAVCFYTLTPDQHFIVDRHPQHAEIVLAAGLSGHGFKFTTVLGEILADWVTRGTSQAPSDFLRLDPSRWA